MKEPGFIIKAIMEGEETTVNFFLANQSHIINLHNQVGVRSLIAHMKTPRTPVHIASLQKLVTNSSHLLRIFCLRLNYLSPNVIFQSLEFSLMCMF